MSKLLEHEQDRQTDRHDQTHYHATFGVVNPFTADPLKTLHCAIVV